jgi:hypothetical protein
MLTAKHCTMHRECFSGLAAHLLRESRKHTTVGSHASVGGLEQLQPLLMFFIDLSSDARTLTIRTMSLSLFAFCNHYT